jgi:hypothetical protein
MAIDIGRIAYQAYCENIYDGTCCDVMPLDWKDLGKRGQDAWRHAAVAVLQYIDKERRQLEIDKDEDDAAFGPW